MSGAGPRFALSSPPYEATPRLIPRGMTGRARKRREKEWAGAGARRREGGNKAPAREENKEKKEGRRKLVPVKSYRAPGTSSHHHRASMDPP